MYRTRDPRVLTTGSEEDLVALWKFDEGRGTVAVDSASWRSPLRGGISRFGVVSPAVAAAVPASSVLETPFPDSAAENAWEGPRRPGAPAATWIVSTAPVGTLARSYDGRPFFVRVNGTDAHVRRPLQAMLTRVPAGGTLSVAASIGESPSAISPDEGGQDAAFLKIDDVIPVGTRLVYTPDAGAHDPWLDENVGEYGGGGIADWTSEGEPYDWFTYRVEAEGGGEASANEAMVALSVRPDLSAAHLDWPSKVGAGETLSTVHRLR